MGEGLEGADGLIAFVDEHGGVGAIEGGHPGLLLAADEEAVDRAAVEGGVFGIGEGVLVVGGVLGVGDDEVLEAGAAGGEVEFSGDGEDAIAEGFGFEFAAILAPEQGVARVELFRLVVEGAGLLAVGGAGEDEAVELFEGAAEVVAEGGGEPVEEFGVGGEVAHVAEVVRGIDEAAAEVVVPDAVDDAAPGEGVLGVGDPVGEGGAAGAFGGVWGEVEAGGKGGDAGDGAGGGGASWFADIAAGKDGDGAGLAAFGSGAEEGAAAGVDGAGVDELGRGEGLEGEVEGGEGVGGFAVGGGVFFAEGGVEDEAAGLG